MSGLTAALPWTKIWYEYFGFLAHFAIYGALGFRFLVLHRLGASRAPEDARDAIAGVLASAERRTAVIGLAGAAILVANLVAAAGRNAAAQHVTIASAVLHAKPAFLAQLLVGLVLIPIFAAPRRSGSAWAFAALAGATLAVRNLLTLDWSAFLNSMHEVSAGLWLGTLFVLVVAGLSAILVGGAHADQRGPLVAELVRSFSPLALRAAIVVAITGVANAYVHLKYVAALWTTPYGNVLSAKLGIVVLVVAVGAWNWRRLLPGLGTEEAAHGLRRSSRVELAFAMIVLVLTAVLLGLPEPKAALP